MVAAPGGRAAPTIRRTARWLAWLAALSLSLAHDLAAQTPDAEADAPPPIADQEPITPIPDPPAAEPARLALGERLFSDRRLSHDGTLACASCHDIHTNGADGRLHHVSGDIGKPPLATLTVFNAALSFRFNWRGNVRTLQAQTEALIENPANMASNVSEILGKLDSDPTIVRQFQLAYGRKPDKASLLDAIAVYERSLVTPDSRFDRWLKGDRTALSAQERHGYLLFQSLGCVSCHQGVNVGGNLYERHGIFHPLASPWPEVLRVPSLRNVAVLAPYFHDDSAPTLEDAVREMALAQLDQTLADDEVSSIIAFLRTLTGKYRGVTVTAPAR
jgi:cytochrome c peroxidase